MTSLEQRTIADADCELRFDNLTRQLYASDASLYQIEPLGVAFPKSAEQARSVITAAAAAGVSVIPRGAGSGLSGGAVGDGLVVEFSRYNRQIFGVDLEKRTVRVGAGVVLDQLNAFLKPHGFCFGPDVATSSRATIGGMIANNSSGARVPVYGTTADHVISLELVLADGRIVNVGPEHGSLSAERQSIAHLVQRNAMQIAEWMPPGMLKRWSGYGIQRFSRQPNDLTEIFSASEGTLGGIFSADLNIVPLPAEKGLGLIFFASVAEAMQATVELLDLKPAAIEHIDKPLFDQTKGQLHFQAARDLMELDTRPCESILIVEFYDNVADKLAALSAKRLGLRTMICRNAAEMNLVWMVRKAGLSLITGCVGDKKPVAFIEDAAVPPRVLPEYVAGIEKVMKRLQLDVCYYGHAATGLLHIRPSLDLHTQQDRRKYREIADEVSALVRQFKGSLAAEHGVGIARTEYMREQVGDDLLGVMRAIKRIFDPKNLFNPGKLIGDGEFKIDSDFRTTAVNKIELPWEERLAFAFKDRSFVGNLEQCNGCGGCRKDAPTMCPTFLATGEEYMSTRGRANTIRAALEMRVNGDDPLLSRELDEALSNCLSCKACTEECPSNVNLALLKAELMYETHRRHGMPLRNRMLSHVDLLGRLGTIAPTLANGALDSSILRKLMERVAGLTSKRPLPHYAHERFDRWFATRHHGRNGAHRGEVILWDDTFVRYHEPHIGKAAVAVLEAAGFHVTLPHGRKCCGRPAFSQGNLDYAARLGAHNLALLANTAAPILFLEPSCYSMFVDDYRELRLDAAEGIAKRCFLFETFIDDLLRKEPNAIAFNSHPEAVAIHAHCHAKSLIKTGFMAQLAERLPGRKASVMETGCCGMAGAFGALESKYNVSLAVADDLLKKMAAQPSGATIVASGTSCRHQIEHLTPIRPKHFAELLADGLAE
jgi:FAD/FMN-containing dehydrogenase/Fe-S oxidoreductase